MKKIVLSLALVLSISVAFGAETKPVVGVSKTTVTAQKVEIPKEHKIVKQKNVVELYCASGTMCDQAYSACGSSPAELGDMLAELARLLCKKTGGEEGD